MGAPYSHISELLAFFGLDLRSSDLTRKRGFASDGSQDCMHSAQGAIKTRYGSKVFDNVAGKVGICRYDTTSILGVSKTEIIGFGANSIGNSTYPYRLVKSSFVLTNSHASTAATVTHYYDEATTQFRFKIVRGTTLIDQGLGTGLEGGPYTLASLETAVDALTSFSMSTPANASAQPAAFMELLTGSTVAANGGTLTVYYYYWDVIDSTVSNANTVATLKNAMFEVGAESCRNVSTAVVRGVLYMAPGNTVAQAMNGDTIISTAVLTKYDGQDFYRAGFADADISSQLAPNFNSTAAVPAVSLSDSKGTRTVSQGFTGAYNYGASIVRIDKAGNRIESNVIDSIGSGGGTASGGYILVQVQNLTNFVTADKAYGYRSAKVNGVMSSTLTLTVDSGYTLTVGSIAYFWETGQERFIQREVTALPSATSITISTYSLDSDPASPNYDIGGTVSTLDNALITNNFRLVIWRTKAGGQSLFISSERPLGLLSGGHQYEYDETTDGNLGAEYVAPDYPHSEPPKTRYIAAFNDQLIAFGNDQRATTVYFSDDSPEYFPAGTHEFDLDEKVNGGHQTGEVFAIGTRNTLNIVSGDLRNFAFRVSKVGNNIGVTSHFSMKEAMEGVLMFSSYKGPYVLYGGRDLKPLGAMEVRPGVLASRLEPYWTTLYGPTAEKPVFERAIAEVLPNDNWYVLFVPVEDPAEPGFATSDSVVFAYNYARDAWYKWTGLNMAGGMAVLDDELVFSSRSYDGSGAPSYDDIETQTRFMQKRKAQYNYADHATAITFRHRSHWEALGKPSFFKRFLRLKTYFETFAAAATALTVKTYVDYDTSKLSMTDTLSLTDQKSIKIKLKSEVCSSMQLVYESSAYYQPVAISGYELETLAAFRPEFKE